MTWRYDDRVKVTTSAPLTGAFPYNSAAVTGFNPFTSIPSIVNGDTVPYAAWDGAGNWETGYLTYSTASNMARTVKRNSAGNTSAINFTGAVTVWCSGANAAFAVIMDPNGNAGATTFNNSTLVVPTRQVFLSGSALTYTTPAGVRQLRIRMVAGGGGGGGSSGANVIAGTAGNDTIFNGVHAAGGGGAPAATAVAGQGGTGFTSGTGTASLRIAGGSGQGGGNGNTATNFPGGSGGNSAFGGGGVGGFLSAGGAGTPNSGGGGGGAESNAVNPIVGGGGGGAGEYVEIIINAPAGTYTYTVGTGGAGGSSTQNGGAGGNGCIIVDEIY